MELQGKVVVVTAGASGIGEALVRRVAQERPRGLVVTDLDGRKSLYSTAFYDRETFRSIYGGVEYDRLKSLYDSSGRLRGLYEKVVERQ